MYVKTIMRIRYMNDCERGTGGRDHTTGIINVYAAKAVQCDVCDVAIPKVRERIQARSEKAGRGEHGEGAAGADGRKRLMRRSTATP